MSASLLRDAQENLTPQSQRPGGANKLSGSSLMTTPQQHQHSTTPLDKFVKAKYRINETFQNIENYISDTAAFIRNLCSQYDFVQAPIANELDAFSESIKTIKSVLARDKMKVVFFGRTSNGKSTVVNAMLHSKVLPSGIGHTTRCFLQVEASPTGSKYILTEGSDEQKSLQSIDSLSNALCSKEMGEDALVRVLWPKDDSKLLTNEVVLLDSPGVDLSHQTDTWIDKHCLDADVFVLVSNAESTLTQTEKNFFFRVKSKLSKPNLFILNNRWDASAAEPEYMEKVREQHMQQFEKFFVEELGACTLEESRNRVFFVSARETLQSRLKNKGLACSPTSYFASGHESRMMEFEEFERRFELCISQSAIETKFESHIKNGERITDAVYSILDKIHNNIMSKKEYAEKQLEEKLSSLRASQSNNTQFVTTSNDQIQQLSKFVQMQVFNEFSDEIRRLENVIDSFQKPFSDDPNYLITYKLELVNHISGVVTNDLQIRFTGGLLESIINRERAMITDAAALLPQSYGAKAFGVLQFRQPFRFAFAIHFPSLMNDFQEDLQFRFSLAPTQLLRWIMRSKTSGGTSSGIRNNLFGSHSLIPRSVGQPDFEQDASCCQDNRTNDENVIPSVVYSSATYVANGGVGLMVLGGLVFRTIGWRLVVTGLSVYGLFYLYERVNWNNRTKERKLKQQIQKHLAAKLKQMSRSVTMNCENQVSKEVGEVLNRLQGLVTEAHEEMKAEVNKFETDAAEFEKLGKRFDKIKKRGIVLSSQLIDFLSDQLTKSSF